MMSLKTARCGSNSVDPNQKADFAASELGLYCLLSPSYLNTEGKNGNF